MHSNGKYKHTMNMKIFSNVYQLCCVNSDVYERNYNANSSENTPVDNQFLILEDFHREDMLGLFIKKKLDEISDQYKRNTPTNLETFGCFNKIIQSINTNNSNLKRHRK